MAADSAVAAPPSPEYHARQRLPASLAGRYPRPVLPFELVQPGPEPQPTENLADAIERAYRTNPTLGAQRYELRATDEGLGQALAQLRPTAQVVVQGGYSRTDTGQITEANRSPAVRLSSPGLVQTNDATAQLIIEQPLSTGGRASAAIDAAREDIRAGREALRGAEGDLLQQVIAAYADVRRDSATLAIRRVNIRSLEATLGEVVARRQAGELTRTDIAQAETQLQQARVQLAFAEGQLEISRAGYAALVGADPGTLAEEPPLPLLPPTVDAALATAAENSPDLAQAIHVERASRARIAVARAEARPSLSLRGTAETTGEAAPFHTYNQDRSISGRLVLTIPLTQGGRVGALVAEAADRNAAERLRIEVARRQVAQAIVNAWNQMVAGGRAQAEQALQLEANRVYYEGTFDEYRAGLRSTFDFLFAQNSLRETQVALLASRRDSYVAQAALLRQIGMLEITKLTTGTGVYQAAPNIRTVERRGALPWDAGVRAFDRLARPGARGVPLEAPERLPQAPRLAPGAPPSDDLPLATRSPAVPLPGTVAGPAIRRKP